MLGTTAKRALTTLGLAAALVLGGCGDDDTDGDAADSTTDTTDATTGSTTASTAGSTTESTSPPADDDTVVIGEEVDICGLLSGAELSEAAGNEFRDGSSFGAQESLLGECGYTAADPAAPVTMISVSVRPADEFDATVNAAGGGEAVETLDVDASSTDSGLIAGLDDYTLVVLALGPDGRDRDVEVAVAEVVIGKL